MGKWGLVECWNFGGLDAGEGGIFGGNWILKDVTECVLRGIETWEAIQNSYATLSQVSQSFSRAEEIHARPLQAGLARSFSSPSYLCNSRTLQTNVEIQEIEIMYTYP